MPTHAPFAVEPVGERFVATCTCCWKSGSRPTRRIARQALTAHIDHAPAIDAQREAKRVAAAEASE